MNKECLDYIVDCHVLSWKADHNYSVNLFGFTWEEKDYIMAKFKERIRM
jgi:hypothetical protein